MCRLVDKTIVRIIVVERVHQLYILPRFCTVKLLKYDQVLNTFPEQ